MYSDNKIIDGMFGLTETVEPKVTTESGCWKFLDDSDFFLANERSGIIGLLNRLASTRHWMPFYLSPTMIKVLDRKKTNFRFYDVDFNIHVSSTTLQVMTLSCGQRFGSEDMHCIVRSVPKLLNNEHGKLK